LRTSKRVSSDGHNRKRIPEEAVYPIMMSILHNGVKAQPFLFPAFFAEQPQLLKRLKKVLRGIK
jgi:hypothetical protein